MAEKVCLEPARAHGATSSAAAVAESHMGGRQHMGGLEHMGPVRYMGGF
jgi:hypothetical protein